MPYSHCFKMFNSAHLVVSSCSCCWRGGINNSGTGPVCSSRTEKVGEFSPSYYRRHGAYDTTQPDDANYILYAYALNHASLDYVFQGRIPMRFIVLLDLLFDGGITRNTYPSLTIGPLPFVKLSFDLNIRSCRYTELVVFRCPQLNHQLRF